MTTPRPTRAARITLEPGIYQDAYGYAVIVRLGSGRTARRSPEHRFPLDTDRDVLRACQARERARLLTERTKDPHADTRRGTLAADVRLYFQTAALSTQRTAERRQQFDWWIAQFPKRNRHTLKHDEIRRALNTLTTIATPGRPSRPASASLKNHYRTALSNLFTVLDTKDAPNPVRAVPKCDPPDPPARDVPYDVIEAILSELRDTGAQKGATKPPSRSKARLRVLAYAPLTPAQLWILPRVNVDWIRATVLVPGRKKGAGTLPARKPLTPAALEAFRAFDAAGCWQLKASKSSLWRTFTAARDRAVARLRIDRPDLDLSRAATMHPYDLRHTFATFAYQTTDDLDATRELLDHADAKTTRRYAQGAVPERLRTAGAAIAAAHAARHQAAAQTAATAPDSPRPH
jgi:integrase